MTPAEYREIARALRVVAEKGYFFVDTPNPRLLKSLASVADHMAEWKEKEGK